MMKILDEATRKAGSDSVVAAQRETTWIERAPGSGTHGIGQKPLHRVEISNRGGYLAAGIPGKHVNELERLGWY
jgi:hypothetical protein